MSDKTCACLALQDVGSREEGAHSPHDDQGKENREESYDVVLLAPHPPLPSLTVLPHPQEWEGNVFHVLGEENDEPNGADGDPPLILGLFRGGHFWFYKNILKTHQNQGGKRDGIG